jgi:lipopolysaccharide export LptBFGC system permease protein LptF
MDNPELRREIAQLKSKHLPFPVLACQINLRWALAVTPFLFALLGIPLAIRVHRGGRSIGFGLSLVIVVLYYVLIMGGTGIGQRGLWPPWIAVWMGNMILLGAGVGFCSRFIRQ